MNKLKEFIKVVDEQKNKIDFEIKDNSIIISQKDIPVGCKYVEVEDIATRAKIGDDGYYVIADADGKGSRLCQFKPRKNDGERVYIQRLMPLCGAKTKDTCRMYVAEKSAAIFHVVYGLSDGDYSIKARFVFDGAEAYEDIVIKVFDFDSDCGYSDMAVKYREYKLEKGDCIPLIEKVKTRPAVAYAEDSPEIRIRMGWKPAPPKILEQTPENEPEMFVACTFTDVSKFLDELKNVGVEKAQICLVGWNKSGHDGRYPQLFPVEEKLGGEEELRKLVAHGKELGYNIVCHTNSTDCYSVAENFSEDIVTRKLNGDLDINEAGWSGGRMYNLCPACAEEFAKKDLPKVAELGFEGLHYIDVMSVIALRWCHSEMHPSNPAETLEHYNNIMEMCHKIFGGFASEGVFDFAARYLDYGLYVSWPPVEDDMLDVDIPLWSIAYHGIILANPTTDTVNFTIKDEKNAVFMAEYGARPSFYIYSKFMVGGDQDDWLGKEDLILNTDEDIRFSARMIKKGWEDMKEINELKNDFILSHKIMDDGKRWIKYSSGAEVCVDYNNNTFEVTR